MRPILRHKPLQAATCSCRFEDWYHSEISATVYQRAYGKLALVRLIVLVVDAVENDHGINEKIAALVGKHGIKVHLEPHPERALEPLAAIVHPKQ